VGIAGVRAGGHSPLKSPGKDGGPIKNGKKKTLGPAMAGLEFTKVEVGTLKKGEGESRQEGNGEVWEGGKMGGKTGVKWKRSPRGIL